MKGYKKGVGNAIVGTEGYRPMPQSLPAWRQMRRVMDLIMMGFDDAEIVEKAAEEFGVNPKVIAQYQKAAVLALDDKNKEWKSKIIEQNYNRLDVLIKECYEKGKYKEALTAVDLQNKLAGVYEQRLKIDSPIFTIKIGEDNNSTENADGDNTATA